MSAAFMVFVATYGAISSFDLLPHVIGIVGLVIGFVPLAMSHQRGGVLPLISASHR